MEKILYSPYKLADDFKSSRYKDRFRYIKQLKQWMVFDNRTWLTSDAYDDLYTVLAQILFLRTKGNYCNDDRLVKLAIENLERQSYFKIRLQDIDKHNNLLNCRNGVINLDNLEFIPHETGKTREFYITQLADVNYDKNAECPIFQECITNIFSKYETNIEVVKYMQKILGLAISGYNYEQSFYFLHGNGRNGKTTLVEIIKNLLGTYAGCLDKSFLKNYSSRRNKSNFFHLMSKRFMSINEFEGNDNLNESAIKQLTGGDTISFEFNKEVHECKLNAKFFCLTNNLPKCTDGGLSMARRIKVIPFNNEFSTNADLTLQDKLANEKSGILNWLIKGYQRVDKSKPLEMPKELKLASETAQNDTIQKSTMYIEHFLIRDEKHLMTVEQAVSFINAIRALDIDSAVTAKDTMPRILAIILKKYALGVQQFDSKTPKIYIGVGLSQAEYNSRFGTNYQFRPTSDNYFIANTDIESQFEHYKDEYDCIKDNDKYIHDKGRYEKYIKFLESYKKKFEPQIPTFDEI